MGSCTNGASATSDRHQSNLDPGEERRYLEQKQRQRLLQDSNFRLLEVVHGEARMDEFRKEIKSLTVVTPVTDPTIAEDVKRKGWYCLSHLWGDPSEWIVWDDVGAVDGDTGELIKPKVLPDKRDKIMSLLQWMDGYWWIDIFCAQSNTPLVIMGDIYKHCRWCFALIDCPYETSYDKIFDVFADAIRLSNSHLKQAAEGYLDMINKTHHKDDVSAEWTHVLKNLLHWASTHFEEETNQKLIRWKARYSRTPRAEQFFDSLMQHPVDEKIAAAQKFFSSTEYNPGDFDISEEEFMEFLQRCVPENLRRAQQGVVEFLNCRWMGRVWTLQELALPRETSFLSVELERRLSQLWMMQFRNLLKVITTAYEIRERTSMVRKSSRERGTVVQTPRQVLNYYQRTDPVSARIYSDYRMVFELAIAIAYTPVFQSETDINDDLGRKIILNSLAMSQRKALFPEDYVYGVLGILNIDIPRSTDHDEIWRIFSKKLREQYPDIYVPSDVNLAEATKMEDVYGGFGFPTGWDVSAEVVDYICGDI